MPSKPFLDNLCGLSSRKPQPPSRSQSLQSVFFFRNSNNVECLSFRDENSYDDTTTYSLTCAIHCRHQGGFHEGSHASWSAIGGRRGRIHRDAISRTHFDLPAILPPRPCMRRSNRSMDYMDVRRRKVPCLSISSGSRSEGVTRRTPFAQPRVSPKITRAATSSSSLPQAPVHQPPD